MSGQPVGRDVKRVLFVLAVDEATALLAVRLVAALVDALLAGLVLRHVVDRAADDAAALVGIAVGLVAAHAEHVPIALVETLFGRPST